MESISANFNDVVINEENTNPGDQEVDYAAVEIPTNNNFEGDNFLLPAQMTRVFRGCLVHSTPDQDMCIMEDMVVGVRDGKILFVDPSEKLTQRLTQYNIRDECMVRMTDSQFLMPGFVDCHAHASQYSFLGTGNDLDLMNWLQKYTFPAETRLKDEPDYGQKVYEKCVGRTLKCGTTTVSYYATVDTKSTMALVKALESKGQRAFVGKVNMDMNGPTDYIESTQESLNETNRFVSEMLERKISLVKPCVTPRFALSCSMDLMKDLSAIANREKLHIQTHLSENPNEVKAVLDHFPDNTTYCDVYDTAGLLGQRTMLAHAIHLSHQELTLIRNRGSGICHCPSSNFNLGSGVMSLKTMLDMGMKVGLGTDFAGGPSPSMLDAIRRGLDAAKIVGFTRQDNNQNEYHNHEQTVTKRTGDSPITYKHLFRLATLGSCEVMGLDDVIGNFEVGKDFDAILVDTKCPDSPMDTFPTDSKEDIVQKFIFLGDDRNITRVFVQGRQLIGPE